MMRDIITEKIHKLIEEFYQIPRQKFEPGKSFIGIGAPIYDHNEANHLIDAVLDNRISMGQKTKDFEKAFSEYIGVKHGIAVNSGTSANTLALSVLLETGEIKKGDEVILPAATFSSVASPVIQLGLVPVYVDVDSITYNIDPKEVLKAISPKTRVLLIVHSLGHPADLGELLDIAKIHNLKVIEDCCEAHGSSYGGRKVGSFGDLATYSFFVAHNITTGEGGMIVTNNSVYADICRSLREFGRLSNLGSQDRFSYYNESLKNYDKKYIFERVGYNVRMTDIEACLGIEQLKKLDKLNGIRKDIVDFYKKRLEKYKNFIQLPQELAGCFHSYYGFLMVIKKEASFSRLDIVSFLEKNNIETRPFFAGCLPDQPAFLNAHKRTVGELKVSRWLKDSALFIGCHPGISLEEAEYICDIFDKFFYDAKI